MRRFDKVINAPEDTILPQRGTKKSAGYDLYAPKDILIPARGYSERVPFNVKANMKDNEFLALYIRSSLATGRDNETNQELRLKISQGTAVVDADYANNPDNDGNIGIMFQNDTDKAYTIKKGMRCAQGIFQQYFITDDDECREERTGGFGSTGTK